MSVKLDQCPICGHKLLRGWTGQGWALSCGSGNCLYRVNEKTNIEIEKALAYYREHKDRRCENCEYSTFIEDEILYEYRCDIYIETEFHDKNYFCRDWQPKSEVKI